MSGGAASLDPVVLALAQNRLDHVSQQMGHVMVRTARSPIFSQAHDFSCFLAGADGQVVAQADGIPIHTGSGGFAVRAILRDFAGEIGPGDVFLLNDPYLAGGNHLPDWVAARPAFLNGRLIGFACNRAHQSDIGGGAAGTYNPEATELFHEGVRLPVLKLIEAGRLRRDLWALLMANTRTPDLQDGDLRAMIGSTRIGVEGIEALARELGEAQAEAAFAGILDHADKRQRAAFAALPPGTYRGEERTDNDCFEQRDVWVRVALTVHTDGTAEVDFAGTDPEMRGFKNSSYANTVSAVYLALTAFFDPAIPRNEGRFRGLTIRAPEGSIVNPRPPAPVTMCTVFVAHEIVHALWKALAQADPARACAGWAKNIFGVTAGQRPDGSTFVFYHSIASAGAGAVAGRDGFNSIGHLCTLGGLVIPEVEIYEQLFPVRFHRQEFRCDSAGPGQWRGGSGVHYEAEVRAPALYSFRGEGLRYISSYGVAGGEGGAAGEMEIVPAGGAPSPAPKFGLRRLGPATLRAVSPGGGGFGDPLARAPEAVLRDVRDDLVSAAAARATYGVALTPDGREVDIAATEALRAAAKRG
ncbi:MAG: hydantoinase B/oxoprolinase family protein [Alphaproteobacteria bacterium]|nr:hydantoinase B/oxoprolinase family protein [Alphaproteobacteria bacterium]